MNGELKMCNACNGDGYFGDFMPGLYPMPCQYCAGTGKNGICTPELHKHIKAIRNAAYEQIVKETPRPQIAGQILEATLRMSLGGSEGSTWKRRHAELGQLYRETCPSDYIPVERESLENTWKQVYTLVDIKYKPLVENRMKRVLEKRTLTELVDLEILDASLHHQ